VLNIGLRLSRLLFRRGVVPNVVADYALSERDAEVVVAAACLLHCVGMAIHREDHERYSLFLSADKLPSLLHDVYEEPERSIVAAEALHAIIGHRRRGNPFTVEGGIVRVADALDMARGRSRIPFEAGHQNIHSLSAMRSRRSRSPPGAIALSAWRSRCPTAPASFRSMSCWPKSYADPASRSTSR
jgi:metal-dependent HD superfamily phosphatase/phosphodiesterase